MGTLSEKLTCQCRRRWPVLVLSGVVLAGVAVRSWRLGERSLWFDEAFCWRMISFRWGEMIERVARDNHPPLYFLVLKAWAAAVGSSTVGLRSLSVFLGGATIVGMYLVAQAAFGGAESRRGMATEADQARGARIGLLSAVLVALSLFQIRWAWDVRMYTLGTALAAFSSWALWRALRARQASQQRCWWICYALLALAFAYTHYYALFSIAAQWLFVLVYLARQGGWRVLAMLRLGGSRYAVLAGAVVLGGWAPWLPVFLRQRGQVQELFWAREVTWRDLPRVCYQMFLDPETAEYSWAESLLVAGLCGIVLLALLWRAGAGEWYVFTAAVVPFVLSIAVSVVDVPVFHVRYFLFAHLFWLAAIAVVISRLPPGPLWWGMAGVVLLDFAAAYGFFWADLGIGQRPGAKGAAEYIATQRSPDQPVVVCSPLLYFSVLYHAPDRRYHYVYDDDGHIVHYEGAAIVTPADLIGPAELQQVCSKRVWAVDMAGGYWGARVVPAPEWWRLRSEHEFPEVYRVQGTVIVREYEVAPAIETSTRDSQR